MYNIGHRIDYNGVKALIGQWHIPTKTSDNTLTHTVTMVQRCGGEGVEEGVGVGWNHPLGIFCVEIFGDDFISVYNP